jgi:hypothetical protein
MSAELDRLRAMLGPGILARIDAYEQAPAEGAAIVGRSIGNACNVEDGLTEWCRGCGKRKSVHPFYPYDTAERLIEALGARAVTV